MQLICTHRLSCVCRVSILTRAFARVQPDKAITIAILGQVFQSSLELSPECNMPLRGRPGLRRQVSILTRAFARVQRSGPLTIRRSGSSFQSSLELSPECNTTCTTSTSARCAFQSSLELSPECNRAANRAPQCDIGFNPHSSFRPSATDDAG